MTKFIHLRIHSEYSLSSGAIKIKDFVKFLKKKNIAAAAITDSHNMFGALQYALAASKEGIQPIMGCEMVVDGSVFLKNSEDLVDPSQADEWQKRYFCKMVFLAKDDEGFQNLLSLLSNSYLEREANLKPHLKLESLKNKSKGLIILSGGIEGIVGRALLQNRIDAAEKTTKSFKDLFADDFYMELQRHGLSREINTEKNFIRLAYDHNVPLVATNNCHFFTRDMFEAQDALSCIAEGRYVSETNRPRLTPEHYLKEEEEMVELFQDIPEALENTLNIAKKISTMAYGRKPTLPHFDLPKGVSEAEEMARLAREGLEVRLQKKFLVEKVTDETVQAAIREQYFKQLEFEIGVINQMDFPGYFLICADFIVWSKNNGVPIGPGRGSGAGSMVAWALKITDLDPIKFGLFFERFLNPERVSMPDFDVDFCQRGRGRSIEYVQHKYGRENVAQIITFGKLQSKAVLKDVGRVLEMSYSEVDKISKSIPFDTNLADALEMDSDLRARRQSDPEISKLFSIAMQLEGLNRHSSVHAAGIVIGDKPLEQICPLYFDEAADMPVSQYDKKYCEEAGLVKFDFLGLKTLTVIKDATDYIENIRGVKLDMANIPLDDKKTFELLKQADSLAVFQVESMGMISMLKQIKPDNIEDIVALISLYRPGPMDNIPTYIRRKHGLEKIEYMHPKMEPILRDTYGIIIYQEQVMNIAKVLAGYSLGGADLLRRAMGKKIKEEMDKQRDVFVRGCREFSDIEEGLANEIFDLLAKFAEYGFNKAHAAAYAVISYQTAFLKAHYPVEFMTATLNMEITDTDKINYYLQDIKQHHIEILPPDVNRSSTYFSVELTDKNPAENGIKDAIYYSGDRELTIRYGLAAIKGVGREVTELLVAERTKNGEFKDIFDFCLRLGSRVVNKKTMESLIKSGAFDNIHPNRRQLHDSCEILINYTKTSEEEKESSQFGFFDSFQNDTKLLPKLPALEDWIGYERYQREFEAFGFYLKNHPLDTIREELQSKGITFFGDLKAMEIVDNSIVKMAGVIISTSIKSNERGKFAYISLSDPTGLVEMTLFNGDMITEHKDWLDDNQHNQLVFECGVRNDESGLRINIKDMWPLDNYLKNTQEGVRKIITPKNFSARGKFDGSGYQSVKKNGAMRIGSSTSSSSSNGGNYAGGDNGASKNDNREISSRYAKNTFIDRLRINISSDRCLGELSKIINLARVEGREKYTLIEICTGEETIALPQEFYLTNLEVARLKNVTGVEVLEEL